MKCTFKHVCALVLLAVGFLGGCEQKIVPPVDTGRTSTLGDTNYVEIMPPWGGFQRPQSIMIGNDQLIYVADYEANEVIMLDAGGTIQKRRSIPHPVCMAQNSSLDLYVGGETVAPGGHDTIGAIYKINLVRWDTTYVARIDTVIDTLRNDTLLVPVVRDTVYYFNSNLDIAHMRIVWQEPARPTRRFTGIGILPKNEYLVARTGSDNSSFIDPDTRVLRFRAGDTLRGPVSDLQTRPSGGTFITDIRYLTGLMVIPSTSNFVLTQSTDGVAYGAVYMVYLVTANSVGWQPGYDPSLPTGHVDFVRAYQFRHASAIAFDRSRSETFIVDSDLDSVFKFDRSGKFKTESFGKYKTASSEFPGLNHPTGIAFSTDCTLYVADDSNKVVRRFKISTQTRCAR